MFTTAQPGVATPRGGSARKNHRTARRIAAAVTAFSLGSAFAIGSPLAASAADSPSSYAEGEFLSGTLLGMDLSRVLALDSAEARNDGTQPTQTSQDPLAVDVVQALEVDLGGSLQLDAGDVLQVGAVAQYAEARNDGTSFGASGAVADDGAIGVGEDTSAPPANATLDLEALLGAEFASTLADLKLELGAIAASAAADVSVASGDYSLANASLTFSSPAIADLTPKVNSALQEVDQVLAELVGPGGALIDDVNRLLLRIDPLLNLVGTSANVSATIDTGDLGALVQSILGKEYGDAAVSLDLEAGTVRVDLGALLGGLDDLPENTELLSDEVVLRILGSITATVSTIADQVVANVEEALNDATVDIHADLSTNVAQSPIVRQVCELVDRVVATPVLGTVSLLDRIEALANGLVGSLTDGVVDRLGDLVFDENGVVMRIVGFVNQTVQETVCSTASTPVAPLTTSVALDVTATVDQLLDGVAANATADIKVLGIPAHLSVDVLLDDLGSSLLDGLFDSDSAITDLVAALDATLVRPAVDGLLGSAVGTVENALSDVLSVRVNIKETTLASASGMAAATGGTFTQTAVRVSVLGSELATLNLAQATVGPNVTTVVDGPAGPGGPGSPGGPDGTGTAGAGGSGSLAYTGAGIATLIAVIIALLAAGAYLVRESYRRNHPVASTID